MAEPAAGPRGGQAVPRPPRRDRDRAGGVPRQLSHQPRDDRTVGQTLRLAALGIALGTAASWTLVRAAGGLLFGVTPRDPGTFVGMAVILTIVALAAGHLPARRASRVDPMVALRAE